VIQSKQRLADLYSMRPSPPDPKQRRRFVTIMPNSVEGRDIAYQMHPNVNLRAYEKTGGLVIESGDGIYVTDNNGKRYIEAMAGLWSVALGFGEKRLAAVAKAQMEKLPRRDADQNRAGADVEGALHLIRFGGQRPRRQDGVVPLQRARQTGQEEDYRPP
jgi:hypothetical protein